MAPSNNGTALGPESTLHFAYHHPVLFYLFLYSCVIYQVSHSTAETFYQNAWIDSNKENAKWFYNYHTKHWYFTVFASICLSQVFLLSHMSVITSFGLNHLLYFTLALMSWTFSITVSARLKPIKTDIFSLPQPRGMYYVAFLYMFFLFWCGEFWIFYACGNSEKSLMERSLFLVTKIISVASVSCSAHWFTATKMHVIKDDAVVSVLIRSNDKYSFEEYSQASNQEKNIAETSIEAIYGPGGINNFTDYMAMA